MLGTSPIQRFPAHMRAPAMRPQHEPDKHWRTSSGDSPALKSQGRYACGGAPTSAGAVAPSSSMPGRLLRNASAFCVLPGYQATRRGSRASRCLHTRAAMVEQTCGPFWAHM